MTPFEEILIGCILSGERDVLYLVEDEDLTAPVARLVLQTARTLQQAGKAVDLVTIDEMMSGNRVHPGFGPLSNYVIKLTSPSLRFSAINALKRARAVREAQAFQPSDYQAEELPHKLLECSRRIQGMLNYDSESLCDISAELKRDVPKTPTGFPRLDELLDGGIERGGVFTIGGIPGDGKTTFATHMVANALTAGRKVHFISLEMTRPALVRRVMKAYWRKTQEEIDKNLDDALQMAGELTVTNTLSRLPDVVGSLSRHAGADLIFIDYAQRVRDENYRDNRVSEIENIYGTLANFAREFEVPLVVLSQLSRDYKNDRNEAPQMYHMKGSGAIEADSHVIGLLHNPNAKDELERKEQIAKTTDRDDERVLYIRKNRNGRTGMVRFVFDKPRSLFLEDTFYDA